MKAIKKSLNIFTNAVNLFWSFVATFELDIRQNGHRGRMPPCCLDDPWNEEFAQAYELLAQHLKRFRQLRYFKVPAGLAFFQMPLLAETAHQALMFFLNPAFGLYGEMGVLDSPEYIAIKEAAMAELEQHQAARLKAKVKPKCSKDAKTSVELIELMAHLRDHHFPEGKPACNIALGLKDLQKHFGWSQGTATRRMKALFKTSGSGMDRYKAVFSDDEPLKGYRKELEDSTLDVDALWFDRSSDDDEDELCSAS
jgi:hypothetical protein